MLARSGFQLRSGNQTLRLPKSAGSNTNDQANLAKEDTSQRSTAQKDADIAAE
jgi:hypothetical protein